MAYPPLILASASPRRAALLRQFELDFQVVPSEAEEVVEPQLTARELCQLNAYRKARAVAKQIPDDLVLGADTLVNLGHRHLGKPPTRDAAWRMLADLSGREHQVLTGVCLVHLRRHRQVLFAEETRVFFKELTSEEMNHYLDLTHPFDKAGGYAIQEHGELLVDRIEGSFSNVVGLPLERLIQELDRFGDPSD